MKKILIASAMAALSISSMAESNEQFVSSQFNQYTDFEWGQCPEGFADSCSFAQVPIDWDQPDGQKIDVLVSKHEANIKSKGQLWLLQGGPGGSGNAFEESYEYTLKTFADNYDVYVMEHRGVGWSTELNCQYDYNNSYYQESIDCRDRLQEEFGGQLFEFNITNAAKDLEYAIAKSKTVNWQPSYVYGVSYGTLWAQRFTQVSPYGAQAVILDSLLPPKDFGLDMWDQNAQTTFDQWSNYCEQDSFCSEKLGPNVGENIHNLMNDVINNNHCSGLNIGIEDIQFNNMIVQQVGEDGLLSPFLYRLSRCNDNDIIALNNYAYQIFGIEDNQYIKKPVSPSFSQELFNVIAFNEINDVTYSFEQKREFCQTAITCSSFWDHYFSEFDGLVWSNQYSDEYVYQYMNHYMPVLVLNGDLDPQTPNEEALNIKGAFTNVNQRYVEFPKTRHAALFASGWDFEKDQTCGVTVMNSFLNNIWGQPDTSCTQTTQQLNYHLDPWSAAYYFGAEDAFDGLAVSITPVYSNSLLSQADEANLAKLAMVKKRLTLNK